MFSIWKRINDAIINRKINKAMGQGIQTSMPIPDVPNGNNRNPSQTGNVVSVQNAQSWNKETHPQGRGDSYLVQDIDYDGKGTLDVTYRDGFKAEYNNIDPEDAKDFARADSKGRWARAHLWNLPYKRV